MIALFLAFSETLGKSAQTAAISDNVEASNSGLLPGQDHPHDHGPHRRRKRKIDLASATDPAMKAAIEAGRRLAETAARYNAEPETHEGRKQLAARADAAEKKRDNALAKYHHYEFASAAFQIGIVLASATVITGIMALSYLAVALGTGLGFMAIALFAPHAVHLF